MAITIEELTGMISTLLDLEEYGIKITQASKIVVVREYRRLCPDEILDADVDKAYDEILYG